MTSTRQSNVETVQQVYDGFNEGDLDSVLATMADDIEWVEPEGSHFSGVYHGPDTIRTNVFEPARDDFEAFDVEPDRFVDAGDTVVALGAFHATTNAGERFESPFAHVHELQDGNITRFENYTDTALWQ
ncbi:MULTISPECIES: nuclear transport factor 2 family protein [unclassified Haladaptatus]|uniref:nuclear transport factor 2 family protein n=1 Tax=unclassified Haladaptatus TaxID=2622732 RepID=UPI00209C6759|nr:MULTISPECIES: nuclear transport factor 2 family protein [unclassified Haladaptatus]MCO8244161.1 nuclear transport factor 2 family protein [Haladaptatus sp. AB643]MCO8255966.1 nuclear transport factor 2 family protein [Haladaptatus sp. AB618]